MYFTFKNMKFYFIKMYSKYILPYENTWVECPLGRMVGKRQTEENHPKVNCIKRILPGAIGPKTSALKK